MQTHAALPLIIRGIEACLPDAERCGVVLALENHGRLPGHSYEVRMLLDHFNSRFLQCTFDCANFMGANMDEPENPLHAYANLRGRIAHVHVKALAGAARQPQPAPGIRRRFGAMFPCASSRRCSNGTNTAGFVRWNTKRRRWRRRMSACRRVWRI